MRKVTARKPATKTTAKVTSKRTKTAKKPAKPKQDVALLDIAVSTLEVLDPFLSSVLKSADRIAVEVRGEKAREARYAALLRYAVMMTARAALLQSYKFAGAILHQLTEAPTQDLEHLIWSLYISISGAAAEREAGLSKIEREQIRHYKSVFSHWPYAGEDADAKHLEYEAYRHYRNMTGDGSAKKPAKPHLGGAPRIVSSHDFKKQMRGILKSAAAKKPR